MEHVALVALAIAVAALLVRDARRRDRIRQLERRAVTAEADAGAKSQLATVGELVSALARQLKTPLQGVLGNTEVMLATDSRAQTEELRDIHEHAARAADIVRNLIAFSEATALTRRWHDLNEVCTRAIEIARPPIAAAGNVIQSSLGPRLPLVYVDGRQLEKAIAALVGHAGAVRAARRSSLTGTAPLPIVFSTREVPGDMLMIDVEFPNVTEESLEYALAAGELDACRHVIRAHGGRVSADRRRAGAAITIELPAAVIDVVPSPGPDAISQESSSPWTTSSTSSTSTASVISKS